MKMKTLVIQAASEFYQTFAEWARVRRHAHVKAKTPQVTYHPGYGEMSGWTVDGLHFDPNQWDGRHIIQYYNEQTDRCRQRLEKPSDPIKPRQAETSENDLPWPRPEEDKPI